MGELAFAIAKRKIVNYDKEFIVQALLVQRNGDKPVMNVKLPFDWVMATMGWWNLVKKIPTCEYGITTIDI